MQRLGVMLGVRGASMLDVSAFGRVVFDESGIHETKMLIPSH